MVAGAQDVSNVQDGHTQILWFCGKSWMKILLFVKINLIDKISTFLSLNNFNQLTVKYMKINYYYTSGVQVF